MKLNDQLITSFEFENKKYDIDLTFNNVLDTFEVNADKTLYNHEKVEINLSILLDDQVVQKPIETWNYIYENFISSSNHDFVQLDLDGNPMPTIEDDSPVEYDIEQDAAYIYASFRQTYGINLYEEQGKMHWYEFRALLNGLPSGTILQRIIQIRGWKPSKYDSDDDIQEMRKLQRIHALRDRIDE